MGNRRVRCFFNPDSVPSSLSSFRSSKLVAKLSARMPRYFIVSRTNLSLNDLLTANKLEYRFDIFLSNRTILRIHELYTNTIPKRRKEGR